MNADGTRLERIRKVDLVRSIDSGAHNLKLCETKMIEVAFLNYVCLFYSGLYHQI